MGNEFRVNSYQNNWQRESNVLALADGGFVVTWASYFNEYDDSDLETTYVAAQFYDAAGRPVGDEQVMRAVNGGHSGEPQMTQLENGNLVLTWIEALDDAIFTNHSHIMAQVLSATGEKVSGAFQVDTVDAFQTHSPDVVATADGGFVVSYGADTNSDLFDQVYHRAYSASGTPRAGNKVLNVNSNEFDELVTKSTVLSNGNSVVIWTSEAAIDNGGAGENQLRATILDEAGKVVRADFGLTPHIGSAGHPDHYGYAVAARDSGGFVVANLDFTPAAEDRGTQGIYFSAYDAAGRPLGAPVPIFEQGIVVGDIEMARLATGQYVVTWTQQSLEEEDVGDDAYALIVSADGRPVSRVFEVGVDGDRYDEQEEVSVAALAGGGFVISYNSESIDSENDGIAARIYGRGTAAADDLAVDFSDMLAGLAGNDRLTGNGRDNWLLGGSGSDTLVGQGGRDVLEGGSSADRLQGGTGNDTLDGGTGGDVMQGGTGNDLYIVGNAGDRVSENGGGGTDTVRASVSFSLAGKQVSGTIENLILTGSSAINGTGNSLANLLTGNGKANALNGGGGADELRGMAGNDALRGSTGNDRLDGGSGNDRVDGGSGKDTLTGGSGYDAFVFAVDVSAGNVDKITDFSHDNDRFELDGDVFEALDRGVLDRSEFVVGSAAKDASDHIVYDRATGRLYYDSNGNRTDGMDLVATLVDKPWLTADDFLVI